MGFLFSTFGLNWPSSLVSDHDVDEIEHKVSYELFALDRKMNRQIRVGSLLDGLDEVTV